MSEQENKNPEHEAEAAAAADAAADMAADMAAELAAEEAAELAEELAAEFDPVAELQAELADMKDRFIRLAAEMENLRKRAEREKADAQTFAITRFARDILTVADNMDMALATIPQNARDAADDMTRNLLAGVEMTQRELLKVFENHGVTLVAAEGTKFDPNMHEALFQIPSADAEPGTVVQVVTNGFKIGERLLRPAKVGVSVAAPSAPAQETGEN